MKFIFPQNYNFRLKLLGFIDYSTAILNVIIWIILYFFINIIFTNLYVKILIFIIICFQLLILSIIGINHENVIYVFLYIIKFLRNRHVYLYIKQ